MAVLMDRPPHGGDHPPIREEVPLPLEATPGQTRRILILDDDALVGQTIQMMIEEQGIGESRVLSTSGEFFAVLGEWEPSHAILDLAMPGMDGVQIIRELSERAPDIRIVLLSGLGQRVIDSARIYARERGPHVDGALEKPVSPARLRQVLCSLPADDGLIPIAELSSQPDISVADIRGALSRGEIEPFYQPRVNCATRSLVGFEALARWRRGEQDIVMPPRFLDQLESGGLMDQLTESMAEQALRWFSGQSSFGSGLTLSLNIARESLRSEALLEQLVGRCKALELDPTRIVLEVSESAVMSEPKEAVGLFTRARARGFELSVDDFGSGYASLAQLVRLPFSELKIDQGVVRAATQSRQGELLLSTIVDLAANLQMRATAEGVEDAVTCELLASMGCSCAQGFFFSEALPADEVTGWAERWEASQSLPWESPPLRYG